MLNWKTMIISLIVGLIFFKAVIVLMCNHFPRLLKTLFFYLFCKYFEAISVASSVQVTLQFYSQIFYSTAPNKIVIRLTKPKNTNC